MRKFIAAAALALFTLGMAAPAAAAPVTPESCTTYPVYLNRVFIGCAPENFHQPVRF